ncbi:MAG: hypothetical protein G01um101419_402 [Parcubacteria group bacterium Gr01-1014_19]|nr:MAG: hypothetical protein G01um101419_402 [Parcubacteria group bacterium Gr01-1014_19]
MLIALIFCIAAAFLIYAVHKKCEQLGWWRTIENHLEICEFAEKYYCPDCGGKDKNQIGAQIGKYADTNNTSRDNLCVACRKQADYVRRYCYDCAYTKNICAYCGTSLISRLKVELSNKAVTIAGFIAVVALFAMGIVVVVNVGTTFDWLWNNFLIARIFMCTAGYLFVACVAFLIIYGFPKFAGDALWNGKWGASDRNIFKDFLREVMLYLPGGWKHRDKIVQRLARYELARERELNENPQNASNFSWWQELPGWIKGKYRIWNARTVLAEVDYAHMAEKDLRGENFRSPICFWIECVLLPLFWPVPLALFLLIFVIGIPIAFVEAGLNIQPYGWTKWLFWWEEDFESKVSRRSTMPIHQPLK